MPYGAEFDELLPQTNYAKLIAAPLGERQSDCKHCCIGPPPFPLTIGTILMHALPVWSRDFAVREARKFFGKGQNSSAPNYPGRERRDRAPKPIGTKDSDALITCSSPVHAQAAVPGLTCLNATHDDRDPPQRRRKIRGYRLVSEHKLAAATLGFPGAGAVAAFP